MRFGGIIVGATLGILLLLALAVLLFAGRQVALVIDLIATSPAEKLPIGHYDYGLRHLTIGGTKMELFDVNEIPVDIRYDISPDRRLTLHTKGKAFPLGTLIGPVRTDGPLDFPFTANDGDTVSLTRNHGLFAWPTPFEVNWLGGRSPIWRRNLYYRLNWHKKSGESFALVWRFEQGFFRNEGWKLDPRLGTSGLVDIAIVGPADGLVETVPEYLRRTKGWVEGDYRLEPGKANKEGDYVVRVIHRFDEQATHPGGGLSIELVLDHKTLAIKQERGMQ